MGALGIFFPFFSLYLRENAALAGWQVGACSRCRRSSRRGAAGWGMLADRTGSRARVLACSRSGRRRAMRRSGSDPASRRCSR
jgi:hypothetical protein